MKIKKKNNESDAPCSIIKPFGAVNPNILNTWGWDATLVHIT